MPAAQGHKHTGSVTQNHKAQLANAYNELGKELSSTKIRVVGNYNLGRVIGEGAYGKVRMGTHRLTSTRVAIKQIPKAMSATLTREIHHHRQLHHPHVTQMYEVIATESSIWIVTELCSGGELFDYLAEKGRLNEDETKIIFGQLCLAVAYLHEKGVVHRDLKLENVLLDERCRVKLGDFGFTREFERGNLMETFCGTTGYASPEMLECKKYLGAEVDIWSLGIILYCLLTGTLPFDDDDEDIMRQKIIQGDFEDPEWLSQESRDLIKNILQKDPTKRLTISQILAHPWFTSPSPSDRPSSSMSNLLQTPSQRNSRLPSPDPTSLTVAPASGTDASPLSAVSDLTFVTASQFPNSNPSTPDERDDPFECDKSSASEITMRKAARDATLDRLERPSNEEHETPSKDVSPVRPPMRSDTSSSRGPPAYPVRTPARTKRRSVSSTLSDPSSPSFEKFPTPLPPQDFSSLLSTPAPIIFSTPLERNLLNSLSALGFDTGQIVHSVLSDACDAAGAIWWMLRRKAEKKAIDDGAAEGATNTPAASKPKHSTRGIAVQTDSEPLSQALSLPELSFVPPTPTAAAMVRSGTPPTNSKGNLPFLSPSATSIADSARSNHSSPGGGSGEKQGSKGRREGKARSGSVSIMQRANTALEAVGIVRKKSSEAVRDEKEKDKEREKEKARELEKKSSSGEDARSSHGSGGPSSRLAKSPPPLKPFPSTPSASPELKHPQPTIGSPWVVTGGARNTSPQPEVPTPSSSPGDTLTSLPNFSKNGNKLPPHRNRASLLTAFRLWFNEDRKGKRKDPGPSPSKGGPRGMMHGRSGVERGTSKRRPSTSATTGPSRKAIRTKRTSASSRRSSSVNSRRSSGTSGALVVLDSPTYMIDQVPRRSVGSHTPNSERGEYPSRPSSVRSFSMHRHRKSPSASSAGSAHFRTASPLQKYHRRGGSGSSTRVVRQMQHSQSSSTRPSHVRSNSAASSIQSMASSRPASFYEPSESDGQRTSSPFKAHSRSSVDDGPRRTSASGNTTFVAQKRQTPFVSPLFGNSVGRSSWKKSWGLEPPGWQSRSAHLPIEVLAISPAMDSAGGIRDVFSGRHSLGDESDWVDEDDDIPAFAGGLGQTPTSATSFAHNIPDAPPLTLSTPPARGQGSRSAKRAARNTGLGAAGPSSAQARQKPGHSPVGRTSPVQAEAPHESETRGGGRRQLPTGRSGPAFRALAIQEEDEGEEE